jgi:uncharacterized protein (TIGR03435 family)
MNAANKPLHKDFSFWIVAVVLVGAASATQLYFGLPWFTQRLAQVQPAPRSGLPVRADTGFRQEPNLDLRKKTYSWQTPRFAPQALEETSPQVVIIPTEYALPSGGWGQRGADKAIGIRMSAEFVVQSAYDWPSQYRMVWTDSKPAGQFDFIANLSSGALAALQAEVKKQWGLVAERETRQTNVVVLKVDHADAPGLKPGTTSSAPVPGQAGSIQFPNAPITLLISYLENSLQIPVVDQTGLTGRYDIQIPNSLSGAPGQTADRMERLRTVLLDQLGLNLIATNAVVEMLVVKKASQTP